MLQNHKKWEYVVWLAAGARNGITTTRTGSGAYIVYRDQVRFLAKRMIFAQQDAIKVKQPQQQ